MISKEEDFVINEEDIRNERIKYFKNEFDAIEQ